MRARSLTSIISAIISITDGVVIFLIIQICCVEFHFYFIFFSFCLLILKIFNYYYSNEKKIFSFNFKIRGRKEVVVAVMVSCVGVIMVKPSTISIRTTHSCSHFKFYINIRTNFVRRFRFLAVF